MSTTRPFVGIALLCLSAHLGATQASESIKEEPQCRCSIHGSDEEATHLRALENYEEAWRRNFDEQWSEAGEASDCAGWLDHKSTHWSVDARNFAGHH